MPRCGCPHYPPNIHNRTELEHLSFIQHHLQGSRDTAESRASAGQGAWGRERCRAGEQQGRVHMGKGAPCFLSPSPPVSGCLSPQASCLSFLSYQPCTSHLALPLSVSSAQACPADVPANWLQHTAGKEEGWHPVSSLVWLMAFSFSGWPGPPELLQQGEGGSRPS